MTLNSHACNVLGMTTTITLNETITRVDDYRGHWTGTAFFTHHRYGHQVHRTRDEAARWNEGQREVRPAREGHTCTPHQDLDDCPSPS